MVSVQLDAALDGSHARALSVTVHDWTTDAQLLDVPVSGGALQLDLTSQHYASGFIQLADLTQLPSSIADPLSGFAETVVRIRMGAYTPDGPEYVTLPDLLPAETRLARDSSGQRVAQLQLVSPSEWIQTGRMGQITPSPGETAQQLIRRVAETVLPFDISVTDTTDAPVPLDPEWTADVDPWTACRGVAEGAGIVCETQGRELIIRMPHQLGAPDALLDSEQQITALDTEVGRGGAFANRVIVRFDTPTGQVTGDASVSTGPLRWGGPAGQRLIELDRPGPASPVTAQLLATELLATASAAFRTQGIEARPDPRITPGQTLRIAQPTGSSDVLCTFVELPFGPDEPMRLGVRTDAATV